jgi:hypothetical protein
MLATSDTEQAMTPTSLYAKTAGLRRVLVHASLFVAVTAAVFSGMMALDRPERISTLAYAQCPECRQFELSTISPYRAEADSNAAGRLQQILRLLHPDGERGGDMAAVLRE